MSTPMLFVILLVVVALVVIFWVARTRGNTAGPHVDTTLTAVGAVTEAVEELADTVKHAVKGEPAKEEPDPAPQPATVSTATPLKAAATKAAPPKPAKALAPQAAKAIAPKAAKATAPKPAKTPVTKPAKATASKAAAAKPAKVAAATPAKNTAADELRQLKGVGPKLVTLLNDLGVRRFDQIAAWSSAEIEAVDAQLGTFKGRIVRDNWVEQAGFLAKGDIAGFEAKFGKLDSPGNS